MDLLRDVQARTAMALLFLAHEVAVMDLGRIVQQGPVDEVLGRPPHPYTQALLSSIPAEHPSFRDSGTRIRLRGDPPSPASPPSGCHVRKRCWRPTEVSAAAIPALTPREGARHPSACHFAARA